METGSWGMDDGMGRLANDGDGLFFRLLSKVKDWDAPPMNSYSSVEEDVVGVISSFALEDATASVGLEIGLVFSTG